MDKFINKHYYLLPTQIAFWWHKFCLDLNIESHLDIEDNVALLDGQVARGVTTICTDTDRSTAWSLFLEDRPLVKEKFPIITMGQ